MQSLYDDEPRSIFVIRNPFKFLLHKGRQIGSYLAGGLVSPRGVEDKQNLLILLGKTRWLLDGGFFLTQWFNLQRHRQNMERLGWALKIGSLGFLPLWVWLCKLQSGDSAWEKNHLAIKRVTNNAALLLHRINLIDKSRLQGEAFSYAGSDLVWKARLFLFVGFALLGFGFAGSCVSTRWHRQRELYSLMAIFMVECDDYQVYCTSWWTRPLLRCGSGHSMWIDHA
jgi:hypothetical protein